MPSKFRFFMVNPRNSALLKLNAKETWRKCTNLLTVVKKHKETIEMRNMGFGWICLLCGWPTSKMQERKYYWSSKFSFLVVNAHRVKELPLLPYLRLIPVSKSILFLVAFSRWRGSNRRIARIIEHCCKSVPSFHCFQTTFVAFFALQLVASNCSVQEQHVLLNAYCSCHSHNQVSKKKLDVDIQ